MTKEEFAMLVDGREYQYPQFTNQELELAKRNNLVIVCGASDDLIELYGAIYDEGDCFDGGIIYLNEKGIQEYPDETTKKIEAIWCDPKAFDADGRPITWTYKTDIPHETFMLTDENGAYCRGMIFTLEDMRNTESKE